MADNVKIVIQESTENVTVRVTQQVDNVKITIGASGGGVSVESDPIFSASPAWGITNTDIDNWNDAHSWGDHALVGYAIISPAPGAFDRMAYFTGTEEIASLNNFVVSAGELFLTNDPTGLDISDNFTRLYYAGGVEIKNSTDSDVVFRAVGPSGYAHFGWYPGGGEDGGDAYEVYSEGELEVQGGYRLTLLGQVIRFGYTFPDFFAPAPQVQGTVASWNINSEGAVYYNSSLGSVELSSTLDAVNLFWGTNLNLNGVNISQIETTTLGTQTDRIPVSGVIKTYVDSAVGGAGYVPASRTLTINGVAQDLSANRTWSVGTMTGTGINGRVSIFTGATTLGTDDLYWDFTNNRLGIGVASPAFALDVLGDVNLTADLRFVSGASIRFGGSQAFSGNPSTGVITVAGHASYTSVYSLAPLGVQVAPPYTAGDGIISQNRVVGYAAFTGLSPLGQFAWDNRRNLFISYSVDTLGSNRDLAIGNGTYNRFRISVPFVGINTDATTIPLDIQHAVASGSTGFQLKTGTGVQYLRIQNGTTDANPVPVITGVGAEISLYSVGAGNGMVFRVSGTGDRFSFKNTSSITVATISNTGRLALNSTALPTRVLEVYGDSYFQDDLNLDAGAVIVQTAKKQTHTISGATFYSGGGDDGGLFTGDYSMWMGDEAAIGLTQIGAYPVNTGYGYGVFNGSKLANATAFGAGSARGVVDMYTGGYSASPTSAASSLTAFGLSAMRDVNWVNASVAVGDNAGRYINNLFRSTLIGSSAGSTQVATKVRNFKRVIAFGNNTLFGQASANYNQTDVIAIGFEAGLWSGTTKSIFIGTYSGYRAPGVNGLVGSNIIHIGHAESADLPISYSANRSNVIIIGNDITPVADNTIIFPTAYSMGVGTLNPQRKLHVEGDMRLTTLVSTPTKIIGVDAAGNIGEVVVGTNLTLTGGTLNASGGGGGGTFVSLSDTPANYTGAGGFLVRVNAGATALEFVNGTTLFAAASHTHAAGDVTSGTFADARIALSNVTQHQASLSIGWSQLTGVPSTFAPSAHTLDSHSNVTITANTSGELLMWNGSAWINRTLAEAGITNISTNQKRAVVTFKVISDTTITTGEKTPTRVVVPYSGTITAWYIVSNANTTATLDVWKANAAIPTGANTITASAKPVITAASFATSSTLTGWTTAVAQGDVMVLEVESNTAAAEIGLFLLIEKN